MDAEPTAVRVMAAEIPFAFRRMGRSSIPLFSSAQCSFVGANFYYDEGLSTLISPVNDNPVILDMNFPMSGFVVT